MVVTILPVAASFSCRNIPRIAPSIHLILIWPYGKSLGSSTIALFYVERLINTK
jgi:hypothetical protein